MSIPILDLTAPLVCLPHLLVHVSHLQYPNNPTIVHYNVKSFIAKKEILFADLNGFDILAFTETWLSPTVDSADLLFPSYRTPFKRHRPNDPRGGIILYIKSDIFATERPD
ncbi:hypothetical protein DPMN_042064 [Dreissena polymorpha]|uniref:RNA-directed DNA polymerase from mobile element jockey n=1 Tax=Dreissena polymorpha TaxID=45954 RepID=A0A9D4D0F3_DREPO|nr:hypothetical protein DPMN_042064 [Dreissena polymorpha]